MLNTQEIHFAIRHGLTGERLAKINEAIESGVFYSIIPTGPHISGCEIAATHHYIEKKTIKAPSLHPSLELAEQEIKELAQEILDAADIDELDGNDAKDYQFNIVSLIWTGDDFIELRDPRTNELMQSGAFTSFVKLT